MQIEIRKARIADAEAIGYVHYHAWIETYAGCIDTKYLAGMSEQKSAEIFKKNRCQDMIVAGIDQKIVGFCGYGKARDEDAADTCGEIHGIYVLQKYQRMSLGKQLLERAKMELSSQGYQTVCLWVLGTNQSAMAFYEKNGFFLDGKEKIETLGKPIVEKRYRCIL